MHAGDRSLTEIRQDEIRRSATGMTTPTPRPRILLITTSFPLSPDSSSGIFVKRLADALHAAAKITVLTPGGCGGAVDHTPYPVQATRYAPKRLQGLTHLPGGIPAGLRASKLNWLLLPVLFGSLFFSCLMRARNTDVIHANWSLTGLTCALAGRIARKPVVVTLRGSDVSGLQHSRGRRMVCALVLKLAQRVVTVSETMRTQLLGQFPQHAAAIEHIPNGVDDALLSLPSAAARSLPLKLIYVGNLIAGKGVNELIAALQDSDGMFTLTMVGDGPARARLQQQVTERGLDAQVRFTGTVAPEAICGLLAGHDVLVLPSHAEGRPNAVVEAMAAARAVVASDLPGIAELITHGRDGLLVPPGDARALRAALQELAAAPSRCTELGLAARARILELGLDWHHCAERYLALYSQVRGD